MPLGIASFIAAEPFPTGWGSALAALLLGCWGLALLLWRREQAVGTLRIPWWWCVFALAGWTALEVACGAHGAAAMASGGDYNQFTLLRPLRYLAASLTLAPVVALLGAKRPQEGMWQLLVVSWLVILAIPAGMALYSAGMAQQPLLPFYLAVVVAAMVAIGAANYIATRWTLSALLFLAGQAVLWIPHSLESTQHWGVAASLGGMGLLVASLTLVACGWPPPAPAETPLHRRWRDFRDAFGAVWALRVAERVNAQAEQQQWQVRLGWHGPEHPAAWTDESDETPTLSAEAATSLAPLLRSLLRRFVTPEWLAARE